MSKAIYYTVTGQKTNGKIAAYPLPDEALARQTTDVLAESGEFESVTLAEVTIETTTTVRNLREWKKS